MEIKERFLNYVNFDTQSDSYSHTVPSTSKQLKLGNYLVEELKSLGIENAKIDEFGVVYGTIPSNNNHQGDVIGFIAHMDTSPDASGKDIHPQIIKDYQGQKITLNEDKELYLDPEQYPQLLQLIHHDLITTDGTTLLGADDKAGIAIIMQMVEYIYNHPEFKHNDIQIAFTPDEEIGHGSDHFNVDYFNAQYAYTIDGGDIHIVEYENFNAFSAEVKVHGRSIHPGSAKNKMVNSLSVGIEFDQLLPQHKTPEHTEGYEGFYYLESFNGNTDYAKMSYILRDHDNSKLEAKKATLLLAEKLINEKYGEGTVKITISDQYKNMAEHVKPCMHLIDNAIAAMKALNVTPIIEPIRGGTDGATLSYMGLPCPNLGTGGFAYHGEYEHITVEGMDICTDIIVEILKKYAK